MKTTAENVAKKSLQYFKRMGQEWKSWFKGFSCRCS